MKSQRIFPVALVLLVLAASSVDAQVPTGTIIINKGTIPGGGTGFGFTDNIASPNAFSLDDGQSQTFLNVLAGTYTVTEDDPGPTYALTGLSAVDPDGGSSVSLVTRTITVDLDAGETVTCGFFNSKDEDVSVTLSSFRAKVDDGTVTLTWTTGSETENLGYHVYRSLKQDGEYEKLTADLMEGAGSSRTTQAYEFVDQDVEDGATYFYKLEQVDFDGTKKMHGPVAVSVGKETAVKPSAWGAVKALLK